MNALGNMIRITLLTAVAVATLTPVARRTGAEEPQATREQLQEALQNQLAVNEGLKARIDKLTNALKSDVCANPAATDALLKESATPTK